MSSSATLRLPLQPSKSVKLPSATASSASTTVLPTLTRPNTSASSQLTPSLVTRTCSVCCRHTALYNCPRCNVSTCSLECYKQHSGRCVEEFASREEKRAMTGVMVDDDTKRDTVAMLKRVQQQQAAEEVNTAEEEEAEGEEEGEDEEVARLLAAAGEGRLALSSLSPEQQRQFLRAVHDGTLSRHIAIAVPWWVPARGRQYNEENDAQQHESPQWQPEMERKMVEEIEQVQSEEGRQTRAFVHSLPPLPSILATEPSPAVPYHVLELVYGYCYLYRLYNCEPDTDLPTFLADLLTLSPSLSPAATSASHYQSTATTLQHCLVHTRSLPSLYQSPHFSALMLRDCSQLCLNTTLLFRLLRVVSEWCDSGSGGGGMRRVGRKIWFMCVWLQDRGVDVMRCVGGESREVWRAEDKLCRERVRQQ